MSEPISHSFSTALAALKAGNFIQRNGWNGSGLMVKMQVPDEHSKMSLPYLYIEYPADHAVTPGARCPWMASQTDILADDWIIYFPKEKLIQWSEKCMTTFEQVANEILKQGNPK